MSVSTRCLMAFFALLLLASAPTPPCSATNWQQALSNDYTLSDNPANSLTADPVINLMVVYTPEVIESLPWINTKIKWGVEKLNRIMARSQVNASFNLVFASMVNYREGQAMETQLRQLADDEDGVMDEIHDWRDAYGADLVSLWVDSSVDKTGGLSYVLSPQGYEAGPQELAAYGFNVINYNGLVKSNVWAHELGHNLGADHEEYQVAKEGGDSAAFPDAMGYVDLAQGFATVMAYGTEFVDRGYQRSDINYIPYYSNPNVYYHGQPTGNDTTSNVAGVLNHTTSFVAQYR